MSELRRRLLLASGALLAILASGTFGYWWIGDGRWTLGDCFYMVIITLTTVGYGEVLDGMEEVKYARLFTTFLLLFGMGTFVYFASNLTALFIEGDLKEAIRKKRMRKKIRALTDHVVVCGAGSVGRRVIEELYASHIPQVTIDHDQERLALIEADHPGDFLHLMGDCTDDELLADVNLPAARGLVAAMASDKDNLYLVVTARQVNPRMRIVARASDVSVIEKLKKAGADSVVSPSFIGGMRMVSELIRPEVVRFLDVMLKDSRNYRIEEILLPAGSPLHGGTVGGNIERTANVAVLAVHHNGDYVYNPRDDFELNQGMTLVVLGPMDEVIRLREMAAP
jgi:voltage-gated potassium channel